MQYKINPDGTVEKVVTEVQSETIRETLSKYGTKELDDEMLERMSVYDTHKLFK